MWTGLDMSTTLLPEGGPGIDADPVTVFREGCGEGRSGLKFDSLLCVCCYHLMVNGILIRGSICCPSHISRPATLLSWAIDGGECACSYCT